MWLMATRRAESDQPGATLPASPPNPALVAVTEVARGGGAWWAISAALAIRRGRSRRLAVEGMVAVLGAMAASHAVKAALPFRRRPQADGVPARQALPERPRSSSFPSSHAATSAAFTIVLWSGNRVLGAAVGPVAVAATYGRVRTRVHRPDEVAAGAALGALVAGLVIRAFRRRA